MDFTDRRMVRAEIDKVTARLNEETSQLRRELQAALQRIDTLEMFVESVVQLGVAKHLYSSQEWQVMVSRVDLLDGVEDGKRHQTSYRGAPVCPHCQHYVNPNRPSCVYCGEVVVLRSAAEPISPYRGGAPVEEKIKLVDCGGCARVVPQTEAYFSRTGNLVCTSCFQA